MSVLKRNTKLKERLNPSLAAKPDKPVITPKVIPYPESPEVSCSIAAEDSVPYGNKRK
jgi:exodeoxyribonuclease V alpha subunit